jgi:4-nitrophenyl phosphatase/phosphoglycolate phosphatase
MRFSRIITATLSVASSRAFTIPRNTFSSSTRLFQSVPKLTDPTLLMDQVDVFIFDCDGVIWRGDSLIDGIPDTLEKLRAAGKRLFFVTNNSTKSRKGYKKKFDSLGLSNVPAEEIFSSSFAAAAYLEKTQFAATNKKVYVIGEVGICEELDLIGVPYLGGPADKDSVADMGPGGMLHVDESVGAVVVGFDRHVNYYKIQYAQLCINELGAEFIATNLDAVTHLTDAQEWAGNGSMVGAIKGCTGKEPTVVGKPSPLMIDYMEQKFGFDRSRICMVGDRLDTDVLFGKDNGLKSLLVLSGVTSEEKLLSPDNKIKPDYYAETINDFFSPVPAESKA